MDLKRTSSAAIVACASSWHAAASIVAAACRPRIAPRKPLASIGDDDRGLAIEVEQTPAMARRVSR
jgi:hypothetical protein